MEKYCRFKRVLGRRIDLRSRIWQKEEIVREGYRSVLMRSGMNEKEKRGRERGNWSFDLVIRRVAPQQ